jgi:hypothetical protein
MASFTCGALKCKVGKEAALALKGGGPSKLVASEAKLSLEGFPCPKEAKFSATYAISTPDPIFVAQDQRPTVVCEAAPATVNNVLRCPDGKAYSGETISELETGTQATFTSSVGPAGTISCSTVQLVGKFQSSGLPVLDDRGSPPQILTAGQPERLPLWRWRIRAGTALVRQESPLRGRTSGDGDGIAPGAHA